MAVGRISGPLLKANLERNGIDLAVETDLLYIDATNNRIGIIKILLAVISMLTARFVQTASTLTF